MPHRSGVPLHHPRLLTKIPPIRHPVMSRGHSPQYNNKHVKLTFADHRAGVYPLADLAHFDPDSGILSVVLAFLASAAPKSLVAEIPVQILVEKSTFEIVLGLLCSTTHSFDDIHADTLHTVLAAVNYLAVPMHARHGFCTDLARKSILGSHADSFYASISCDPAHCSRPAKRRVPLSVYLDLMAALLATQNGIALTYGPRREAILQHVSGIRGSGSHSILPLAPREVLIPLRLLRLSARRILRSGCLCMDYLAHRHQGSPPLHLPGRTRTSLLASPWPDSASSQSTAPLPVCASTRPFSGPGTPPQGQTSVHWT